MIKFVEFDLNGPKNKCHLKTIYNLICKWCKGFDNKLVCFLLCSKNAFLVMMTLDTTKSMVSRMDKWGSISIKLGSSVLTWWF